MKFLTTQTRNKIESLIHNINNGIPISLKESIELYKYGRHIPYLATKIKDAHKTRPLKGNG